MKCSVAIFSLVFLGFSPWLCAYGESDDVIGYDEIVSDLNATTRSQAQADDPFADIMIHAGVGMVGSYATLEPESGRSSSVFLAGMEVNFGIDLFSRHWLAEGALRSFNSEKVTPLAQVSMREFDLRIIYRGDLARRVGFRLGGGLAARYTSIRESGIRNFSQEEYSTPASILSGGLEAKLSRSVSLVADLSLRQALIDQTVDQSAAQAGLRLDGHF